MSVKTSAGHACRLYAVSACWRLSRAAESDVQAAAVRSVADVARLDAGARRRSRSARAVMALAALDRDIKADVYGLVDRLFVTYKGRAIANYRYERDYRAISKGRTGPLGCGYGCTDPSWMHEFNYYHPDWHPYFQGRDVHSLQSVTKSVAATLIGIALGRGEIAALDRPFLDLLSGPRSLARVDPRLRRATLEDVLTMRSGIEWHEQDRPLDSTNTTVQLEASRDWIAFTLAQPMDADPGTKWAYNSGGSMLLSGIIKSATGQVHRRLRERASVPAARHQGFLLEADADGPSGH